MSDPEATNKELTGKIDALVFVLGRMLDAELGRNLRTVL